jgi:hypothetical protein
MFTMLNKLSTKACKTLLNSPEFQSWINSSPKIDLIIFDIIPDCAVGISYKLNAKLIMYSTVAFYGKMELFNVVDESVATYCDQPYKPNSSFLDRIKNTLLPLGWAYFDYQNMDNLESVLKDGLNITNLPNIYDLYQNVSLVLMTGNYISKQPRSLPPMFVSVPALHLKETH